MPVGTFLEISGWQSSWAWNKLLFVKTVRCLLGNDGLTKKFHFGGHIETKIGNVKRPGLFEHTDEGKACGTEKDQKSESRQLK